MKKELYSYTHATKNNMKPPKLRIKILHAKLMNYDLKNLVSFLGLVSLIHLFCKRNKNIKKKYKNNNIYVTADFITIPSVFTTFEGLVLLTIGKSIIQVTVVVCTISTQLVIIDVSITMTLSFK
jgi:hypothetical protein